MYKRLRRFITVVAIGAAVIGGNEACAATGYKTFFHHLDRAWAVGEIDMFRPMEFRDGRLLAFPAKVADLTYSRKGRVSSLLIIDELRTAADRPHFEASKPIFAAIAVLPEHSYWRDNLPRTPRHTVLGGLRDVFTGDEIAKVKPIAATYTSAFKEPMPRKAELKLDAVSAALGAGIERLSADAAEYLLISGSQHSAMSTKAREAVSAFLRSRDPLHDRLKVIDAIDHWKMKEFVSVLEELGKSDSGSSAAALRALDTLGKPRTPEQLASLLRARTDEVRAYAAGIRAERADELNAWGDTEKVLRGDDVTLKQAVAAGLGRSGSEKAVALLSNALRQGGDITRAAASSLAKIGSPEAVKVLEAGVTAGVPEARTASVIALAEVAHCKDCWSFLNEQFSKTEDDRVRRLIRALTARPDVSR